MQVTHVKRGCCVLVSNEGREVSGIVKLIGRIDNVLPCRAYNAQDLVTIDLTRSNTGYSTWQKTRKGTKTTHHAYEISVVIISIV